jgi:hypothetical protein
MIILKNGGIKIIIMSTKLKAILGLASISLLIYTTYEQNKTINSQRLEIDSLKKSIEHIDSAASKQLDELEYWKKQYDSLYSDHWSLKTYTDIKEGRAEE